MFRRALTVLALVLAAVVGGVTHDPSPAQATHGPDTWQQSPCRPTVWWMAVHVYDTTTHLWWDGVRYTESLGIWGWSGPFDSWGPLHDGYTVEGAQCGRLGAPVSQVLNVAQGKWMTYYRGGEMSFENYAQYKYCWCGSGHISVRYY